MTLPSPPPLREAKRRSKRAKRKGERGYSSKGEKGTFIISLMVNAENKWFDV
jgi:hypothetical protein